ncbi:Chaperone protein dnaJ 15 [Abeliophyllum distichum]|uniref:Chaperone protein dnaJ 15 n=1 Tax=Abeliophyllum distichum TaxID=126358 RepID=A0ABD1R9N2_9LAMI
MDMAKDPEATFFKRLEGLQPCEVLQLKTGAHVFDFYGSSLVWYLPAITSSNLLSTQLRLSVQSLPRIQLISFRVLRKRNELSQFETEYRPALARFQEVTNRYSQEKQSVYELLDNIHSSFTVARSVANASGNEHFSNGSSSKSPGDVLKTESPVEEGSSESKDKSTNKKWFNLNLKG